MGNKVPWKTGMLIYLPVISRPLISCRKNQFYLPVTSRPAILTASILNFYLPSTSRPMKWRTLSQKNSRRLKLSISKNTPYGRWGQGPGSVDPRFPAGLPFPVPEILECIASRDPGRFSSNFPSIFPEFSREPPSRADPRNSHSLLEFSDFRNAPKKSENGFMETFRIFFSRPLGPQGRKIWL